MFLNLNIEQVILQFIGFRFICWFYLDVQFFPYAVYFLNITLCNHEIQVNKSFEIKSIKMYPTGCPNL